MNSHISKGLWILEKSQFKMRNSRWIVPTQENKLSCSTLRRKLQLSQVKRGLFPLLVHRRNQDILHQFNIISLSIELKGNAIHPLEFHNKYILLFHKIFFSKSFSLKISIRVAKSSIFTIIQQKIKFSLNLALAGNSLEWALNN